MPKIKFAKLVHLVSLIIKKFVTTHRHINIKFWNSLHCFLTCCTLIRWSPYISVNFMGKYLSYIGKGPSCQYCPYTSTCHRKSIWVNYSCETSYIADLLWILFQTHKYSAPLTQTLHPTKPNILNTSFTNVCQSVICVYTRVGTLIVATIYLQLIQNRYMFRSFTVLQCSHQHCVQPVASDVEVVGYL